MMEKHRAGTFVLAWMAAVVMLLGACGEDGDGNEDTLFTGLSGLIIAALVIWFVVRSMRKRR